MSAMATLFLVSAETITTLGLYVLLPIFIGFLIFIMWDISKNQMPVKRGLFGSLLHWVWVFLALLPSL